jgi:16S rRNA (cytosine1402-N4)-methyltransferase
LPIRSSGRRVSGAWHEPVLVEEVLEYLRPERGGVYLDGTVGGGGHAEAIVRRGGQARLIGIDRDREALGVAAARLSAFGERVELVAGNVADVVERVGAPLAGALLDLGVSSHQIDEDRRGFSFRAGVPLDMRMAREQRVTAADLLNEMTERELADVFWRWGEERRSRRVAAEVVRRRAVKRFETSDDLVAALTRALGPRLHARDKARLFQALRVEVNAEMASLERVLPAVRDRLEPGGVLVVIAYHSLEDRRVKESFREWSRSCVCPPGLPECRCRGRALGELLTRRVVVPDAAEVAANPRARSARLRAWRKAG